MRLVKLLLALRDVESYVASFTNAAASTGKRGYEHPTHHGLIGAAVSDSAHHHGLDHFEPLPFFFLLFQLVLSRIEAWLDVLKRTSVPLARSKRE